MVLLRRNQQQLQGFQNTLASGGQLSNRQQNRMNMLQNRASGGPAPVPLQPMERPTPTNMPTQPNPGYNQGFAPLPPLQQQPSQTQEQQNMNYGSQVLGSIAQTPGQASVVGQQLGRFPGGTQYGQMLGNRLGINPRSMGTIQKLGQAIGRRRY
jgi:hypothetical protein